MSLTLFLNTRTHACTHAHVCTYTHGQESDKPSVSTLRRTDSVRTAERELQQAERKWRSSGLTVYKELYTTKQIAYTASIRKAKRQYYNDVICNCPSAKQLYNVTNQLLGRMKKTSLPNSIPSNNLPDHFFNNKI